MTGWLEYPSWYLLLSARMHSKEKPSPSKSTTESTDLLFSTPTATQAETRDIVAAFSAPPQKASSSSNHPLHLQTSTALTDLAPISYPKLIPDSRYLFLWSVRHSLILSSYPPNPPFIPTSSSFLLFSSSQAPPLRIVQHLHSFVLLIVLGPSSFSLG